MERDHRDRGRRAPQVEWIPRTELGKKVAAGEVTSIDDIFANGWKIKESQIVDRLLPDLRSEIIFMGGSPGKGGGIKRTPTRRTVRMHSSGRRYKISACAIVGRPGYIGLGKATAKEHDVAINKAINFAKLSLIKVKRGCGSWQCGCGENHSVPIKIIGKEGSVKVTLIPAPKGIGLAIGEEEKKLMRIAGVKDIWSKTQGDTRRRLNYAKAIINAFKNTNKIRIDLHEGKLSKEEEKVEEIPVEPAKEEVIEEEVVQETEAETTEETSEEKS